MSASDKKKLRKEQAAAVLTEKQQQEKKQQKKLKAYTLTFAIVMVLVVALVLVAVLQTPVAVLMQKSTNALTVNDHKISAIEFNYFYGDAINQFYSQYSDYGDYQDLYVQLYTGLVPSKALDAQVYDSETGETWADMFIESAIVSAEWTYAMYDKAMAEGFELSEDEQSSLDQMESALSLYAYYYGYSSTDAYLRALYGTSATTETYLAYYNTYAIASAYANAYLDSLEYTEQDYRDYEADKLEQYNSYSYAYYFIDADKYLTGGTTETDADGKETTVYSDEEIAASIAAALADAESLAASGVTSVDELNEKLNALTINADAEKEVSATSYTAQLYAYVEYYAKYTTTDILDWVTSSDRVAGDLTYIAKTTTDADENETVEGYYVVLFNEVIDNTMSIGTVRHLLVQFDVEDDEEVTDEIKAATLKKAEELLAEYEASGKTEDEFSALVKANSDDTGTKSTGGLIESITPDSGYVTAFTEWATADHEVGDTEIIETEYGYHIMYYVSSADLNYRDTMIENDILAEDYEAWEDTILETVTSTKGNLKYVERDYVING